MYQYTMMVSTILRLTCLWSLLSHARNEKGRQNAFIDLIEGYVGCTFLRSGQGDPHADMYRNSGTLFGEIKNATSCDPLRELIKYFIAYALHPAYLLTLVGPELAVYGQCLRADRLVPPICQRNNVKAMEQIARTLKSLKSGLLQLERDSVEHPEFPFFRSYNDGEEEVKIQYKDEIGLHLFRGTLKRGSEEHEEKCVVKFADCYGGDVHLALALAPKLFTTQKIGRFTA